jgi:hypothetical protein
MRPSQQEPTITVLMSVHNGEQFLPEALDSILRQTFADFELLAFDDCSTDGSLAILQSYARADARVHVVENQRNLGLTKTLNTGLAMARAPYVARMDADDVSLPLRFAKQIEFLESNPQVEVVGTWADVIDGAGRHVETMQPPGTNAQIQKQLLVSNCLVHPSVMFRTAAVRAVGGYSEQLRYSQDYELWLRLAERCELENLQQVLLKYRVHAGQVSIDKLRDQWRLAEACRTKAVTRRAGRGNASTPQTGALRRRRDRLRAAPGTLGGTYLRWAATYKKLDQLAVARRLVRAALCYSPLSHEAWRLQMSLLASAYPALGFVRACVRRLRSLGS